MDKSLTTYIERRKILIDLSTLVYENQLSKNNAIKQIHENFGEEHVFEFDTFLEKYRNLEYRTAILKIFPLDQPTGSLEDYFSKNNETIFIQTLSAKYGISCENELKNKIT